MPTAEQLKQCGRVTEGRPPGVRVSGSATEIEVTSTARCVAVEKRWPRGRFASYAIQLAELYREKGDTDDAEQTLLEALKT